MSEKLDVKKEWYVFPLEPGTKKPLEIGWQKNSRIMETWPEHVGLDNGKSGVVTIDLDNGELGQKEWHTLSLEVGFNTDTLYHITPHGTHVLFEYSKGDIRNSTLSPNIQVRGVGGQTVLPPTPGYRVGYGEIAELPENLRRYLLDRKKPKFAVPMEELLPGTRNTTLCSIAGKMWNTFPDREMIFEALKVINAKRCKPPLEEKEIHTIAYESTKNWNSTHEAMERFPYTDSGNAELFVSQYGENIRYVFKWGKWIIWDGSHWKVDTTDKIRELARKSMRTWFNDLGDMEEEARNKRYAHAMRSESKSKMDYLLHEARGMVAILPEELDKNIWLINAKNCTIDLKTGEIKEAERKDYITKQMGIEYVPGTDCPLWKKCLSQWFEKDEELIEFLQKLQGYCLTGSIKEQIVPIGYGEGANGKDTYINPIKAIMGDYAETLPISSLMIQSYHGTPNDLAKICGARMVTASEGEDGQQLAEAKIKLMTGGGQLSARFLYKEYFDYTPQFKLWIYTNNKPRIVGQDYAIWRRIRLIPFTRTFSEKEQDKELIEKLKGELPGILNWLLEGCRKWQDEGLEMPECVRKAVDEYKTEMDIIQEFLDECCSIRATASITMAGLYEEYIKYCGKYKYRTENKNRFGRSIKKKGFGKDKINNQKCYKGLTLNYDREKS